MSDELKEIYGTRDFTNVVLGAVTVALRECGYNRHRKAEMLYECLAALDNHTPEELDQAYHDYLVTEK